jgi:hypothetical protein
MDMDWLRDLQQVLGELASLERRLQSQPESVDDTELLSAAEKVDKLKNAGPSGGAVSKPWDIFYRKYSAILHPYLQARGLRSSASAPPAWDFDKALGELMHHVNESESQLQTVNFVRKLYDVVEQLESGHRVSEKVLRPLLDQMDEQADGVLDLAPEHPHLPAQFARVRQRFAALVRERGLA